MRRHTKYLSECLRIKRGDVTISVVTNARRLDLKLNINVRKQNGWLIFNFLTVWSSSLNELKFCF